jgi:hypothetical protein
MLLLRFRRQGELLHTASRFIPLRVALRVALRVVLSVVTSVALRVAPSADDTAALPTSG